MKSTTASQDALIGCALLNMVSSPSVLLISLSVFLVENDEFDIDDRLAQALGVKVAAQV